MRLLRLVTLLVLVAIVLVPVGMTLGQQINPVRVLPAKVEQGGTFNVTIAFTGPASNFSGPSLNDVAPAGWNVTKVVRCQPSGSGIPTYENNVLGVMWGMGGNCSHGTYCNYTNFSVLYQVDVPCDASGNHTFNGDLYYYIWPNTSPYDEINKEIGGDSQVQVVPPAIRSAPSITFYTAPGQNPANETLELWSSTPCPLILLNWSITEIDAGWLEAYPQNGTCNYTEHSSVNLSVNTSGMSFGKHTANITINSTEANNSPHIVPVTLHITDKGILKGHVSFFRAEDPGNPTWKTPLMVRFFDNATQNETDWSPINRTTDAYGNFTIDEGIVPGSYDIGIKNATCLSEMNTSVTFTAGNVTSVNFGTVREGDASNDDYIDASDFAMLSFAWLTQPGDGDWYAAADFNRDKIIDASDFAALSYYWLDMGDLYGV